MAIMALLLLPCNGATAGFHVERNEVIGPNDGYTEALPASKGDNVHVKLTANSSVDIYIMSLTEYQNYLFRRQASVDYFKEIVTSADFVWSCPKNYQSYNLVIDNRNGTSGAQPSGSVSISLVVGINDAVMVSPDILCWSLGIAGALIAVATVYYFIIQPWQQKKRQAQESQGVEKFFQPLPPPPSPPFPPQGPPY